MVTVKKAWRKIDHFLLLDVYRLKHQDTRKIAENRLVFHHISVISAEPIWHDSFIYQFCGRIWVTQAKLCRSLVNKKVHEEN